MQQKNSENKIVPMPRKNRLVRRPSSNTSISSTDSLILVKKKFLLETKPASGLLQQKKQYLTDNVSSKLKVCDGEKLSYQVMKSDSKQRKEQFLQKYANDPFMRIKFEKSVQKFNRSKSREMGEKHFDTLHPHKQINVINKSYTTFREQIKQQSQKTVKLINNCKQLVEELKKNRLIEAQKGEQNLQKSFHIPSRFHPKKCEGARTDRV